MARTIVGEAFIQILPTDAGVGPGVQKIIDRLPTNVQVPVTADTDQATQAVAQLTGQIENDLGGAWQAAAAQAALFTGAILGVRAAIEGAVNKLAGLFDQLAQAQAGFTAILGSQSAGQQLLDDIREFARVSPFVTQELVNYSQQLLGVGQSAESIVPLLRSTGDLIASVGGDTQNISRVLFTLTQIRSIGRLVGQDAIQLQSALVPITKLLADFLGKTTAEVKKLQEQGAISADTVFAAITNAGNKVEGAMATATRNIGGARAVLSDTVQIMAQDSKVLETVFQDIVKGILSFSDALGENESLQRSIAGIDEALVSIYEDLQPLLESLGGTSTVIALNALELLTSTLEILAAVLNAIPPGVMEALGQALAIFLTLKAPLALIKYVQSFQQLVVGLKADAARLLTNTATAIGATGTAASGAEKQLTRLQTGIAKYSTAITGAAFATGLFISQLNEQNEAVTLAGQALTSAAIGAQIGTAFAPGVGTAIGAAAGAGLGLVTGIVSKNREDAAEQQKEWEKMGADAAAAFQRSFLLTVPTINTGAEFEKLFGSTESIRETVRAYDELVDVRDEIKRQMSEIESNASRNAYGDAIGVDAENLELFQAELDKTNDEINRTQTEAEAAREELTKLFTSGATGDALQGLTDKLSTLQKESEGYIATVKAFALLQFPEQERGGILGGFDADLTDDFARARLELVLLGQTAIRSADDIAVIEDIMGDTGLSIETLLLLPLEDLVAIMEDKVPSAITKVRLEAIAMNTAFEESKKITEEFLKPFTDRINAAQAAMAAEQGLAKATKTFITDQSDTNALAYAEALLKVVGTISTANEQAFKGTGDEAGFSFLNAQLEVLQEELGLTDTKFQELIVTMGLVGPASSGVDPAFVGTLSELAEVTGLANSHLQALIPSLRGVGANAEIIVPSTILDKIEQLGVLTDGLRQIPVVGEQMAAELEAAIAGIDFLGGITAINGVEEAMGALRLTSVSALIDMNALMAELAAKGLEAEGAVRSVNDTFLDVEARRNIRPGQALEVQNQRNEEALRLDREQKRLAKIAEDAAKEAERLRKEQERLAEEAAREAERAQREAERIAEELQREQERLREALKNASETIQSSMLRASEEIATAAQQWTASIKERVQDDPAVSVARLIRNAQDQANRLQELNTGIETLRARGVSDRTIETIGIDNVTDVRQLRRLLGSSTADLQTLSSLVELRDNNAEAIARRERQQETQATIVAAIIQAATVLGYEITPEAARQLSLQVNITGNPESAVLPTGIIEQIQNAGVLLRT